MIRRIAIAVRDRLRNSWREFAGIDSVDEGSLLFAHERRSAPWLLEGSVLLGLLALCGWLSPEPAWAHLENLSAFFKAQELSAAGPIVPSSLDDIQWRALLRAPAVVPCLAAALVMIALLRAVRTRWLLGLALAVWPPALLLALSACTTLPHYAEVLPGWPFRGVASPPLPVPMWCAMLPPLSLAMAAVMGGIYASRRRFSPARVACGALVASAAMQLALYREPAFLLTANGAARMALLVLTALAFVALPHNRAAVACFAGCDWLGDTDGERRTSGFADSLGVHLAALGFGIVAVGAIGAVAIHESVFRRMIGPPVPRRHSPGLVNAHAILGGAFKQTQPQWDPDDLRWWEGGEQLAKFERWERDPDVALLRKPAGDFLSPREVAELAAALTTEREDAAFARMEPHLSEMIEAARSADYYDYWFSADETTVSSFVPFRDLARLLSVRAALRANRGDIDGALADVEAILRMGGLLAESDGHLVATMIGCAMRGIASTAAESCLAAWSGNPAALARLADLLSREGLRATEPMDGDSLAGEAGLGRFCYPFELAMPGFLKVGNSWDRNRDHYRRVQIALAVLRSGHDRGMWPRSVAELAPEYLPREPLSPFTGWRYVLRPPVGNAPPDIAVVLPGSAAVAPLDAYPTVRQAPPPPPARSGRGAAGR